MIKRMQDMSRDEVHYRVQNAVLTLVQNKEHIKAFHKGYISKEDLEKKGVVLVKPF